MYYLKNMTIYISCNANGAIKLFFRAGQEVHIKGTYSNLSQIVHIRIQMQNKNHFSVGSSFSFHVILNTIKH